MKNPFIIPLLAAISFGVSAFLADRMPSLTVSMTLISVGVAGICTLILLFSISESKKQGRLPSTIVSTLILAVITVVLIMWLLPRIQIEVPVSPHQITPTGFPSL